LGSRSESPTKDYTRQTQPHRPAINDRLKRDPIRPFRIADSKLSITSRNQWLHAIDEEFALSHCAPDTTRILFKTRNSAFWSESEPQFHTDFTYLDLKAAQALVERGIKLVGIDYLSIEKYDSPKHETHLALLSRGVVILEGLNLTDIPAGQYELICLPLRLRSSKGDGAPARVVLRN